MICHLKNLNPSENQKKFYLYTLSESHNPDTVVFVGYDKFVNMLNFATVLKNPGFDNKKEYDIKVLQEFDNEVDSINAAANFIRVNLAGKSPYLNKTLYINKALSNVRCVQTGVVYKNQTDCANNLGISQSRLSQHLARKPGFKTVKGMTFEYCNFLDEDLKRTGLSFPPQSPIPGFNLPVNGFNSVDKSS